MSAVWDEAAGQLVLPKHFSGVIQPTLWEYAPGRVKMLMRSTQRVGCVCASTSDDYGRTWSPVERTSIPNPNSGLDAVRLRDGRIVLVCNPVRDGRTPLRAWCRMTTASPGRDGWTWRPAPGEYSYPSVIQADDGRVHVVATHQRVRIFHYVLESDEL